MIPRFVCDGSAELGFMMTKVNGAIGVFFAVTLLVLNVSAYAVGEDYKLKVISQDAASMVYSRDTMATTSVTFNNLDQLKSHFNGQGYGGYVLFVVDNPDYLGGIEIVSSASSVAALNAGHLQTIDSHHKAPSFHLRIDGKFGAR